MNMKSAKLTDDTNASTPLWNDAPGVRRWDPEVQWFPAVDIIETREEYVFQVDLPGLNPDEIEVAVDGDVLSITGTRPPRYAEGKRLRIERPNGRFDRRMTLPADANGAEISAALQDGVMELHVRRKHQEKDPSKTATIPEV